MKDDRDRRTLGPTSGWGLGYMKDSIIRLQHCFLITEFLLGLGPLCLLIINYVMTDVCSDRPAGGVSLDSKDLGSYDLSMNRTVEG